MKKMIVITIWVVVVAVAVYLAVVILYFLIGGIYGKYAVTQERKLRNDVNTWQTKQFKSLELSFPKYWPYFEEDSDTDTAIASTASINNTTILNSGRPIYELSVYYYKNMSNYISSIYASNDFCAEVSVIDAELCTQNAKKIAELDEKLKNLTNPSDQLEKIISWLDRDVERVKIANGELIKTSYEQFGLIWVEAFIAEKDGLFIIKYRYSLGDSEGKDLYEKIIHKAGILR